MLYLRAILARSMGTKSREIHLRRSVRAAAERAAEARREADRLAVEAWNKRMLAFQGPTPVHELERYMRCKDWDRSLRPHGGSFRPSERRRITKPGATIATVETRDVDAGMKMPTQTQNGTTRCFFGAHIDIAGVEQHVRFAHRGPPH